MVGGGSEIAVRASTSKSFPHRRTNVPERHSHSRSDSNISVKKSTAVSVKISEPVILKFEYFYNATYHPITAMIAKFEYFYNATCHPITAMIALLIYYQLDENLVQIEAFTKCIVSCHSAII